MSGGNVHGFLYDCKFLTIEKKKKKKKKDKKNQMMKKVVLKTNINFVYIKIKFLYNKLQGCLI